MSAGPAEPARGTGSTDALAPPAVGPVGGAAGQPDGGPAPAPVRATRFDRSIVDGPVLPAVWKMAWPTVLQNLIGGLQGIVDHAMVGHFVGYTANAAIGVSLQIFIVVIVFISSLYTGMAVMVARFAGAGDEEKVNRTVYQAFLTSLILSLVLAPLGYVLSPALLDVVNAAPEVKAEALPYLRIMFLFSFGMLFFFMLGGALRSAGDARTPLRFGVLVTVLNVILNVILIRGVGPIPAFGTAGAAMGTVLATGSVSMIALWKLRGGTKWVISFPKGMSLRPDLTIIRSLFRFGLPSGLQGVAMNVAGVLLLRFIGSLQQSAEAQAAYAVAYTELFSFITWTSVGLMGATATVVGQNLGARQPERARQAVHVASRIGIAGAGVVGLLFLAIPTTLLGLFGMTEPAVVAIGVQLLRYLSISGLFITVALTYTGGLHGTGDTRSPLFISIISQIVVPLGICFFLQQTRGLEAADIWLAIVIGHLTRCALSVLRFRQGKWRQIVVEIEPARS